MENQSFVEVSSEKVARMASSCLERIEQRRKEMLDDAVNSRRESFQKGWLHRWFGVPIPSDEEILGMVKTEGFIPEAEMIRISFWNQEETAKKLLKATTYASVVRVSITDLDAIA